MANDQLIDLIDGMTQDERRIKALDPGYIKIDEHKITDLMKFMTALSAQINYYNEKNQIDGDWEDFFKTDLNVLITLITRFDLVGHLAQFEKFEINIQTATTDKESLTALSDLFKFIAEIVSLLVNIKEKLQTGNSYNKVAQELAVIIDGFEEEIRYLAEFNKQADDLFGTTGINFPVIDQNYKEEVKNKFIFGTKGEIKERILPALPFIKEIFSSLRSRYNSFLGVTSFYFKNHDLSKQEYSPHLALCITFLHLYQTLQNQINQLPKQHLDFYYKDVLGLKLRDVVPDSVHIVIEPSSLDKVDLKQGEKILAEVNGSNIHYSLNEDTVVTGARVIELKTLFLDEHIQVVSANHENDNITEVEVYKGSYANIQPGTFLKQKSSVKMWPVLGESQFELADEDRTMDDTELGILLASPVLYQTEGQRTIFLKIYFEQESFRQLLQYFSNFAKVTGKLIQTVSYELLSDAFIISFTTLENWQDVKQYSVRLNITESNIEIRFELSPVDSSIDIYNPEFHGENYDVEWPIVRLLLNNYSTHNPFSFFRKLIISRVTIKADVKGSRAVKLQNNVGNLSPDSPFQPFGPQPSVGSYLEIKNTNIFNRFTKDFCVRLEWIDLPRVVGGWDTYYKEYDANITTDSFKVKLSGLSQGRYKPQYAKQQEFNLFQMEYGEFGAEVLSDVSEITNIDIKKLELPNKPLLNEEALIPDINFTEGAIRLEFSSPQDAFGSRIYPQIFPEAVIHNSKRFAKKRPLPNAPYIPVVKSITIDYTLEHSTVLLKTFKNEDSALKIIHQYPFGYEAVYPESDKQPYHFIPDFDYENNLYIGIKDLFPKQELTMLFQLEERNFNVIKHPYPLTWSYMYDNSWVKLEKGEVLYDTTNNFINTGIVKIKMPGDINTGNTMLSPELFWLRASSSGQFNVMSKLIGVYPHAVTATRIIVDNTTATELTLPVNSIKSFKNKLPGINSIYQLFPSYGGIPAELDDSFYIRVSERLRHKNRFVTNRDIEEAILDQFPQILMAKCVSSEQVLTPGQIATDNKIRIVLVPAEQGGAVYNNEQPRVNLSTIYQIKKFVANSVSPFVEIEVENPVYERIKVIGEVKFKHKKSSDDGLYLLKLHEDIKKYLCPWLYESRSSFKIGSHIYVAELLNYIKKRPYIEYLTGFSVLHFFNWKNDETGEILSGINDFATNNRNYIQGSVPEAVIIPADDHLISIMNEPSYSESVKVGIGNLALAEELLVYDEKLSSHEEEDFLSNDNYEMDDSEYFNLFISHNIK